MLKKLASIDQLVELYKSGSESKVINQDKEKRSEMIELDNDRKEIEKAKDVIEGVKEGSSEKKMSSSLTSSWYSTSSPSK